MKDMVYKFKKYLAIFLQLQKINVMRRTAYPVAFLVGFGTVFLTMFLNILFIKVNFSYITSVAGWSFYQVLAVLGSYMIVEGLMWIFFSQLNPINRHIIEGTLDGILLKPVDNQFLVSFWRGDYEDFARIITGGALLLTAMKNTIGFDLLHFCLFLLLLFFGVLIFYSFNLAIRSISFWITEGSGLWIFMERVVNSSQFPVDIYYSKIVRGIFTFVVPLAFVATVPAKILTNIAIDWKFAVLSFAMTLFFFFGSRWFWKFSLGHYSSASS
ncbi:MAG: ABC-2 family transporter protein [bacterium]